MWLVLFGDNNMKNDIDSWRWKFAWQDEGENSRAFSIKFSENTPNHWKIVTSRFGSEAEMEALKEACKRACDEEFISIECLSEDEEQVVEHLEEFWKYVVKLRSITCVVEGEEVFTEKGENPNDKSWQVRIN